MAAVDPNDDLVEDRAITNAAADHFGHAQFAAQAAATIKAIRTPSNIAIYAPWGSGKTSLANLLRGELRGDAIGFVYFDAFKYAEAPLRREFIRRVAKNLDVDDAKFDRGLYEERVDSGLNLTSESAWGLLKVVGIVGGCALLLALLFSYFVALVSGKAVGPQWVDAAKVFVPAFFAPAIIVSPLVTLIGDKLSYSRTRYAPQSDEEFERLFREVVDKALKKRPNWKRLVIFIDELDRCGADEVASTLETLRTFLEVEHCVFVVAADRAALETSVGKESRQQTPINAQNPYYSAGGSYLDKIFQYQWQLPPMLPSSLSRFAESLVKDLPGLWSDVNPGEVVSVLVPLHVQSPRRVKELLNAYAMAYRFAERRIADHHLDGDIRSRAAELAKLVCLQMEFPLFAADLANEPSLPQLVLLRADDPESEKPGHVTEEVWLRAERYAQGDVALDVVISTEDGVSGERPADDDVNSTKSIVSTQGQLLVRYLQKTRRIDGPSADLVFMEGMGSAFGLPTALAVRLRAAATEARSDDVIGAIKPLPQSERVAALQLLALNAREALPGVEGANAVSTLLRTIGAMPELELSDIVDDLATAANVSIPTAGLASEDLVGALTLGLATTRPVGAELVGRALSNDSVTQDEAIAQFIAEHANDFAATHLKRLAEIVAGLLVNLPWDNASSIVAGWADDRGQQLLAATRDPLRSIIESKSRAAPQPPTGSAPAPSEPSVAELPPQETAIKNALSVMQGIADGCRESDHKVLLESVLLLILSIDHKEARDLVAGMLPSLVKVTSPTLTRELLVASRTRSVDADKHVWLDPIDGTVLATLADGKAQLEGAVTSLWTARETFDGDRLAKIREFAASAKRLADAVIWFPASELADAVVGSASLQPLNQAGADQWQLRVNAARVLDEAGLLRPQEWRTPYLETAAQLASTAAPDELSRVKFGEVLLVTAPSLIEGSGSEAVERVFENIGRSAVLHPAERLLAMARVAKEDRKHAQVEEVLSLEPDDFLAIFDEVTDEQQRELLATAVGTWLTGLAPTVEEAWSVIGRFGFALPDALRVDLTEYAIRLARADRTTLASLSLAEFPSTMPSEVFLEAIHFSDGDLPANVDLIIEKSHAAADEEHCRGIFRLWGALKLTDLILTRRLVSAVMVPWIADGEAGRKLVVENLYLAQSLPNGEKRRLAETIEEHSESDEWERLSRQLVQARFMRESSGIFSRHREHL